ncbi:hypothetical protein [Acinetobacter higginsii]|uniref:hypothetical protein n=1 Tax=Acinetobacter higginsii TaxID=70347 RepID=UPI001F4BB541|nr:hypothetical protein [Acinetobacter higginsii]MCH7294110.1 hypothetical protein [Acinetobacter higginsii]
MKEKSNLNDWPFKLFIFVISVFYILIVILSAHDVPNLTVLSAPISILVALFFWKHQELMKKQASSADDMFKAFHNYAIQFGELYYHVLPQLKKQTVFNQVDIDLLRNEYKEFIKLRNIYFVERESFYRTASIPDQIKNYIHREFSAFDSLSFYVREFLDSKSLEPIKLKTSNEDMNNIPNNQFIEKIGKKIEELIKPYIWYQ